jgi:hypothetical protein
MTTAGFSREPVPGQRAVPALPPPVDRPAREWADKVVTAEAARALGRRLREGKRLVFSDGRHPAG